MCSNRYNKLIDNSITNAKNSLTIVNFLNTETK